MSNALKAAAGLGVQAPKYVDDVFDTCLYTGNGGTQTITNNINLSGKGGIVWVKGRGNAYDHCLRSSYSPISLLQPNSSVAEFVSGGYITLNTTGFSLSVDGFGWTNTSGIEYVGYSFRREPKFFDLVVWTGDGVDGRSIAHSLGGTVGMYMIKKINAAGDWIVGPGGDFMGLPAGYFGLKLNKTDSQTSLGTHLWGYPSSTDFKVRGSATNGVGDTYVAYLFAHDPTPNGLIQCGSFTTDASGNGNFDHGWSKGVQYLMLKSSQVAGDWEIFDSVRSPSYTSDKRLRANLSSAEDTVTRVSASGTTLTFSGLSASTTYIFMAIVAP